MNGVDEWTVEEKLLPKIASRIPEPTLKSYNSPSNISVMSNNNNNFEISTKSHYSPSWL